MKNLVLENEQLLSFLTTITLCGISLSMNISLLLQIRLILLNVIFHYLVQHILLFDDYKFPISIYRKNK